MTRIKCSLSGLLVILGLAVLLSLDKPTQHQPVVHDVVKFNQTIDTTVMDTVKYRLHRTSSNVYSVDLHRVSNDKRFLLSLYKAAKSDSVKDVYLNLAGELVEKTLVNSVFHHWYGTPWDFNGYTNMPNKGTVACGYFVSTTLKHIGFNLNRYQLAQQNPLNEALSISSGDSVLKITDLFEQALIDSIATLDSGLYFVGLDNHVGYLLVRQGIPFFIHSNYIGDGGVCIEIAAQSKAFLGSGSYFITPISNNKTLLKKWLRQEVVTVVTSSD